MRIFPDLALRSEAPELLDDLSIDGHELVESLSQIRGINRPFGAARPTLEGVARLWQTAGRPSQLSILDIGAGAGDINQQLLKWATRHEIHMHIILADLRADACALAAAHYQDEPRIHVIQADVLNLAVGEVDIVTASLLLHHFPARQLPVVLASMLQIARLGVVINDLHRHWVAWAFIWVATRLFSRNRLIQHDAPLSVRRGFRAADFEQLKVKPAFRQLSYTWRPLFRYLVLVPKDTEALL